MNSYTDVIVSTTSSIVGITIIKHINPVSAHIVAGTNVFSDFLGGFSDIFGGRSQSYKNQLTSIYDEAIEKIKYAAYELGGNCVLGLKIDIDEISGKGKSMFMITAVGTVFLVEKNDYPKKDLDKQIGESKISFEKIRNLRDRKDLIEKLESKKLTLEDNTWKFIIENKMEEIFPALYKKYREIIIKPYQYNENQNKEFESKFITYINSLPRNTQIKFLYESLKNEVEYEVNLRVINLINEYKLLDYDYTEELLKSEEFEKQKIGLRISTYDKPFYDQSDINHLSDLKSLINATFKKRGNESFKKQLLSSKEIEVWECECGKSNNIEFIYCNSCNKDIYGFNNQEINPSKAENIIGDKISFIQELIR